MKDIDELGTIQWMIKGLENIKTKKKALKWLFKIIGR